MRVCPETSSGITKPSEHEAERGEAQERQRFSIEVLPILGEPAASIEPSEGALDDPAFGQDHKSLGLIGTLDNFSFQMRQHARQSLVEFGSLIAAVGEQLFQKRKHPKQGRHDENAAIAILNIGRMDDGMKQQAQCVYKNMPLLTLDCFARIIVGRIDAGPPFSALFTLWLSMMAAVGLASLSACSRHFT